MPFPDYVPTRVVTVGGAYGLESAEPLALNVEVVASRSLIWDATGYRFERTGATPSAVSAGQVVIELPCTDVAGWRDAATGDLIDVSDPDTHTHTYSAKITARASRGVVPTRTQQVGSFVVPSGEAPVSLERLLSVDTTQGEQVLIPDTWGPLVMAAAESASDAADAAAAAASAAESAIPAEDKGAPDGVATLDESGVVVETQLPGRLTDSALSARIAEQVGRAGGRVGQPIWGELTDYKARPEAPALVAIGDSITDNNMTTTAWNGSSLSRTSAFRGDGYLNRAMTLAGQPFSWWEVGVSNEVTITMRNRFDADVLSLGPRIVIEAGGTNDIITGRTAVEAFINKTWMWERAREFGAIVIGTNCPPRNSFTDTMTSEALRMNAMIREYAAANSGWFTLFDWYDVLADPLTGDYRAGYTSDNVHPNGLGALRAGEKLAEILGTIAGAVNPLPVSNVLDATNLVPNPMLTGTGGTRTGAGVTGDVADGYLVLSSAATIACSKVARDDGYGDWQQLAVTVSGNSVVQREASVTGWAVGDIIEAVCEFETDESGWSDGDFQLEITCAQTGGSIIQLASSMSRGLDNPMKGRMSHGVMRTPPVVIPPDTISVRPRFTRSGTGTFRLGRLRMSQLPTAPVE